MAGRRPGRPATGSLTYVPRSASCPVGVIAPAGARTGRGSAARHPVPPAAPTGNGPAFQIVGGLPAPASGGNALAGAALLLMDVSLDNVLKEAGVALPAGTSAPGSWNRPAMAWPARRIAPRSFSRWAVTRSRSSRPMRTASANTPNLAAGRPTTCSARRFTGEEGHLAPAAQGARRVDEGRAVGRECGALTLSVRRET